MSEFSIRTRPFSLKWTDHRALYLSRIVYVSTRLPYTLPLLFLTFAFPLLESLGDLRAGHYQTCLIISFIILCIYATTAAAGAFILWHRYRRYPVMNGERIMVLDAGAVRLIGPGFDVRQSWALFDRVRQSHDHVFLYLRGTRAYAIPKQAFASADDATRLLVAARAAIRAARKAPAALRPLPETPDNRETWRSRPFTMALDRPLGRLFQRLGTTALAVFSLALLLAIAQSWRHPAFDPGGILVLLGIVALVFIPALVLLPIAWLVLRNQQDRRGLRQVVFTRDHVRCTGQASDTRVDWNLVDDIDRSSGTFVLRLAIGVFCVPVSAFATPAQATAFYTQAVAFRSAAEARR